MTVFSAFPVAMSFARFTDSDSPDSGPVIWSRPEATAVAVLFVASVVNWLVASFRTPSANARPVIERPCALASRLPAASKPAPAPRNALTPDAPMPKPDTLSLVGLDGFDGFAILTAVDGTCVNVNVPDSAMKFAIDSATFADAE